MLNSDDELEAGKQVAPEVNIFEGEGNDYMSILTKCTKNDK